MKRLISAAAIAFGLAGCVAVPYYGYGEPGPAAGYYYAPAPAVHLRFDSRYGGRGYRPHRYYRHYHR